MLRAAGTGILLLGIAVLIVDLLPLADGGRVRFSALGEWWFWAHPVSLQQLEPAVARHVSPALWSHGIQPILQGPAAFEFIGLGAALLGLGHWIRSRRRPARREPLRFDRR